VQRGLVTTAYRESIGTNAFGNIGGLAVDANGNLYVAASYAIRKISPAGVVNTVAGQPHVHGFRDGFGVFYPWVVTSTNGLDWDVLPTPCYIGALAYGQGTLVGVGYDRIISSDDDGATWTDRTPPKNSSPGLTICGDVTYGNGVFIALGSDRNGRVHILSTSNLVDWARTDLPSGNVSVSDMAYGGGRFVATLRQIQNQIWPGVSILTSTNGFDWQTAAEFPTNTHPRVVYGNGRFVTQTGEGTVITSSDGINWIQHAVPGMGGGAPIFGNGVFVTLDYQRRLWSSSDGVTWTESGVPEGITSVRAGDGVFFARGYFPPILYRSGPLERLGNPRWVPNAGLEWTVTGAPRIDYRIECSEDLLRWQTLSRVTNAPASYPFIDPAGAVRPSRFYRVIVE
jgi:hypothetical protein